MCVWLWLVILLGTLGVDGLNIVGYSAYPVMLMTQIGLALLSVIFGGYRIHLLPEIHIKD